MDPKEIEPNKSQPITSWLFSVVCVLNTRMYDCSRWYALEHLPRYCGSRISQLG
jgi:hypothetical protein